MAHQIKDYIPLVVPTVLFIVWLVRLESKQSHNEKDLLSLSENNKELWKKIEVSSSTNVEVLKALTEIKTKLEIYEKYMRRE